MNRQFLVKAITRLNNEGNRIGLDAIIQHLQRELETARVNNINVISLTHRGRRKPGAEATVDESNAALAVALHRADGLIDELSDFLKGVAESN